MSSQCSQCGSSIPEGQSICSMCMGDINHGKDGYYQHWAEEQERKREMEESEQEDNWRPCDNCDLPDACEDFGCAIENGVRKQTQEVDRLPKYFIT